MKLIKMPNKNALSPDAIRGVQLYPGKGVLCRDAQQGIIDWIPIIDAEKGGRVRDLLISVIEDGNQATQPDWSFLDGEDVSAD